jgi:hypothetical protein
MQFLEQEAEEVRKQARQQRDADIHSRLQCGLCNNNIEINLVAVMDVCNYLNLLTILELSTYLV